jgi:hypothetical protein
MRVLRHIANTARHAESRTVIRSHITSRYTRRPNAPSQLAVSPSYTFSRPFSSTKVAHQSPTKQARPLDGITVVSLEQAIAAPFCTRQLADLGARVIKIERPGVGGLCPWLRHSRKRSSFALCLDEPLERKSGARCQSPGRSCSSDEIARAR